MRVFLGTRGTDSHHVIQCLRMEMVGKPFPRLPQFRLAPQVVQLQLQISLLERCFTHCSSLNLTAGKPFGFRLDRSLARSTAKPPVETNPPKSKAVVEMHAGHIGFNLLQRRLPSWGATMAPDRRG